ncbi:phage tail assembly protein [Virgibacillus halodenitrificans]|uniref:phage tail assembly protein n=1 Tax=Virgibacillus halodenitrificans TaxID=1482 RepID=UPI000EF4961B|nr:phage tail assembly protein [Virgibacillus halodenitrificans]
MSEFVIQFRKPYKFEGKEYKEVDLSGIETLSTKDLIDADKQFNTSGQMAIMNEMTTGYSCIIASKASGKPIEFFESLPAGEGLKVKNRVMGFLNA